MGLSLGLRSRERKEMERGRGYLSFFGEELSEVEKVNHRSE